MKHILFFIIVLYLSTITRSEFARKEKELLTDWNKWKELYEKSYIEEEEIRRKLIWNHNLKKVIAHNEEYELGKKTYRLGMNQLADMTNDEFRAIYLNKFTNEAADICRKNVSFKNNSDIPDQIDWRKRGYVTPVSNQLQCGSCWAFSVLGSLEGQHFKKTGELIQLSAQNLIDCSNDQGNYGCSGGLASSSYKYIRDNGGVDTEKSYPYKGVDGKCHFSKENVGATLSGCVELHSKDETTLNVAVGRIGPIFVAVDASHVSFQLYTSGIYYEPQCSESTVDHTLLLVGYGVKDGQKFWIGKNSWGRNWGEHGYILMSRDRNNNCGIATQASYPTV